MNVKRYHNIIDMNNCNNKISDSKIMHEFIKNVAKKIDMNIIEGPIVVQGVECNPGLSAFAIVDYSHISIHTFTKNNEALIDIFSCKEYDREKALQACKDYFETPDTIIRQKEVWWGL